LVDPRHARTPAERFRALRDRAIIWLLVDTPIRRGELASLSVDDINLDAATIRVMGKGRRERLMPLGETSLLALWDYLRVRSSRLPHLWLDEHGHSLVAQGIYMLLKRLGKRAGIPNLHTHRFRHTFATGYLRSRGSERYLRIVGGWRRIPDTYFRTLDTEDVARAHRQLSPGDRLAQQLRGRIRRSNKTASLLSKTKADLRDTREQEFLGNAENYDTGLRLLDFINAPEESRITINDWVSEQTEGRIKDLIPQGAIDALTRLVLTNAIYFNAAWLNPFEENLTDDAAFHLLGGGEVTVPMMRQTESFGYAEGEGYQAVELLYDGGELSMVILLPEMGQFEAFEDSLDSDYVDSILSGVDYGQVALTMPKFEFESEFGLVDTLYNMGMPAAFSAQADFSGMNGTRDLAITDILHKAFVSVDEAGTEAAAATAVIIGETAMPGEPVEVTVDRPFVFLIRDIKTDSILFIGRVMNPSV